MKFVVDAHSNDVTAMQGHRNRLSFDILRHTFGKDAQNDG